LLRHLIFNIQQVGRHGALLTISTKLGLPRTEAVEPE
jgi:hypothetical protein